MDRDHLGEALRIVATGLAPFVESEMRRVHAEHWDKVARAGLPPDMAASAADLGYLLAVLDNHWTSVFRSKLSFVDRVYVAALREIRQRAHQEAMPPEDLDRAIDTARRLLRAVNAQDALAELDVLTGVTRSGVVRIPPKPRAVETPLSGSRRRSPPSEWIGLAETVIGAFIAVFGEPHRKFGSKSLGLLGVCDDARGAQWSAATDLQSGQSWLAVNLEGIQYDGWPIARFIERELASPELAAWQATVTHPDRLIVSMWRDAWQAAGRVRILEQAIAPTPIALAAITPDIWRSVLQQAQECLNPARDHRGRGQATVTLASSNETVVRDVSPHFNIRHDLARDATSGGWQAAIAAARDALQTGHRFVASQSR